MSIALGLLDRGDRNTSFTTRAVGNFTLALLLLVGATVALLSAPKSEGVFSKGLTVPIVRADLVFKLISRLVLVFIWGKKLKASKLLYENEVFPLQAAAIIWNDCKRRPAYVRIEDEDILILDVLYSQKQLWVPTRLDSVFGRIIKAPVFLILQVLCWLFQVIQTVLRLLWVILCDRGVRNVIPVPVEQEYIRFTGHTALLSDSQLTWIQDFTMKCPGTCEEKLRARKVLVCAIHCANLFSHSSFARLHEHAADGHAMSEYYGALGDQPLIKSVLSRASELGVLASYPHGNKLEEGQNVPREVLWARLVVGSMKGLRGECRWRGPVASAILQIAQENKAPWGDNLEFSAVMRHAYTVTRRWLIDWIMYIWWEMNLPASVVNTPDIFFQRLQGILLYNLSENTKSLPHAVGEIAVSAPHSRDATMMLELLLGLQWTTWLNEQHVASGTCLKMAIQSSGEWKCFGRELGEETVDLSLYKTIKLQKIVEVNENASLADQARACIANQIIIHLTSRIRSKWEDLPARFYGFPEDKEEFVAADSV